MTTQPKAEQNAMAEKNGYFYSNGLLFDTCKHIRSIRASYFSSYHLSGILIDSFVYSAIGDWHWLRDNEQRYNGQVSYEQVLLDRYNGSYSTMVYAPGSAIKVDASGDWEVLGKVLKKMVQ